MIDDPMMVPDWRSTLARLDGAYSPNTLRCYESDFEIFEEWCVGTGRAPLPASPSTVTAFLQALGETCASATLRRRLAAIRKIHRLMHHPNPCADEEVIVALRRLIRQKRRRPNQAQGLTYDILQRMLTAIPGSGLKATRDRALVTLAYDLMCRRSELVALQVDDIKPADDDGLLILVRRSKSDPLGDGHYGYASPETARYLDTWLAAADITDGSLFRGIRNGYAKADPLHAGSVSYILKALAKAAGLPKDIIKKISGHSPRVGGAQDMATTGADLIAIMTAGRWKSVATVARYVEAARVQRVGLYRQMASLNGYIR